ncbi:MAG: DUF1109 domain-containing protein [Xanthobacteraceae bacterium]|nr:DUF1109 domain-containing protein [Xanthobacteraceae bacterium]
MAPRDVIDRISANPRIRHRERPAPRLILSVALSLAVVAGLSGGLLGSPDILSIASGGQHDHGFILNFAFVLSVAACALVVVRDLSVPARRVSLPKSVLALPFVSMAVLAGHDLMGSSLHGAAQHASHASWWSWVWQTVSLAIPAFAVLTLGVRHLAPVDLRRVGAYIGMLAGALGAMGHCWHASAAPFALGALGYTAAIATMMIAGMLLGPRLLRW